MGPDNSAEPGVAKPPEFVAGSFTASAEPQTQTSPPTTAENASNIPSDSEAPVEAKDYTPLYDERKTLWQTDVRSRTPEQLARIAEINAELNGAMDSIRDDLRKIVPSSFDAPRTLPSADGGSFHLATSSTNSPTSFNDSERKIVEKRDPQGNLLATASYDDRTITVTGNRGSMPEVVHTHSVYFQDSAGKYGEIRRIKPSYYNREPAVPGFSGQPDVDPLGSSMRLIGEAKAAIAAQSASSPTPLPNAMPSPSLVR